MDDNKVYLDNAATSFPKPEIVNPNFLFLGQKHLKKKKKVYDVMDKEFRNFTSPKRGSSISSRCGKQR